jgi:GT2 family glycosyltransferase
MLIQTPKVLINRNAGVQLLCAPAFFRPTCKSNFWNSELCMKNLYIIIAVHNRWNLTKACLDSLRAQTCKNFKIVIVDDGSTDGSDASIKKYYPEVTLIRGDGNLWWAGATNKGIRYAIENHADYVLCLNNDTEVSQTYIEKLLFWSGRYPDAIFGSAAYDIKTGKLLFVGNEINWRRGAAYNIVIKNKIDKVGGIMKLTNFVGRGLLIPVNVFQKIGFFDEENFPQIFADTDFTLRAHRAAVEIYCNCDVVLLSHSEKASSEEFIRNFNLRNYYKYLTDTKGGGNLVYQWKFSMKNAPNKYKLQYTAISILRCIFGYLRRWITA